MKNLLLSLVILGLWGCSSGEKNINQSKDSTQTLADQEKIALEEIAEGLKNKAQDPKPTTVKKTSNTSSFGAYSGTESSKITCTNGNDVRMITILDGDPRGCGVVYNKFGVDKTVAVANYEIEYCSRVQNKIKANLESPGFSCE